MVKVFFADFIYLSLISPGGKYFCHMQCAGGGAAQRPNLHDNEPKNDGCIQRTGTVGQPKSLRMNIKEIQSCQMHQ